MESVCQERLRALVRGEFSEEDFISEFATVPENISESDWDLADWISRQHNSGQVPDALFHSLESKIAMLDPGDVDEGATAELYPLGRRRRLRPPEFIEGPRALSRRVIESGTVLRDRYVIEARLGTGGMGTVYKALDRFRSDLAETNRHVAIKILNDDITNRPEVFAKLRREFYCAQSLSHRNIVRVYELDRDGDLAFFTMEFLEGEPLNKIIARFSPGTVTRSYAWRVMREVGAALTHAHARDVVHADLKPQNVLMTLSGDVRLLDFGTSSANVRSTQPHDPGQSAWKFGPTAVTPAYASCELLEGRRPDPRDDLFAFACLTYELLTGQHPFGQRRSTEARAQGVEPARPANIGDQRWKVLSLGLALNRSDRSMAVRDWVLALNHADAAPSLLETQPVLTRAMPAETEPANAASVAPAESVATGAGAAAIVAAAETAPVATPSPEPTTAALMEPPEMSGDGTLVADALPVRPPPSSARWMLVGVLVLASLVIFAVSRRPGAQAPVTLPPVGAMNVTPTQVPTPLPAPVVTPAPVPGPVPAPPTAVPAAEAPAAAVPGPAAVAPSPLVVAPADAPLSMPGGVEELGKPAAAQRSPAPNRVAVRPPARPPARPAPKRLAAAAPSAAKVVSLPPPAAVPAIGIERPKYWVRADRHFAEVRVIRSAGTRGDASFVWWTEPGTARPDEDFLMQMKTTQTFSSGVKTATLFIRIVPNPLRRTPRTFYVQIGHPSAGQSLGSVTKVPILVLPRGR